MLSVERGRKHTLLGMDASNNSRCNGNELCLGMVLRSIKGWYPLGFFSPCRNISHILIRDVEILLRIAPLFFPVPLPTYTADAGGAYMSGPLHFELSGDMFKCCLCPILHLVIHWFNSPESFLSFSYHSPQVLRDNLNLSVYSKRMDIRDLLSQSFFLTQWLWLPPYKPTYSQTLWSPLSCMALLH